MRVGKAFPSKFLKVDDLNGKRVAVTVAKVTMEDVGDGEKPVVHFTTGSKGLVLNKTNAESLTELAGTDEMDDWPGVRIVLVPDKTMYQGRKVACIRVQEAAPEKTEKRGARRPEPEPVSDDDIRDPAGPDDDDDVPF